MAEQTNTRITLGTLKYPVRFSFLQVFEARESDDPVEPGTEKKKFFSTQVLIDKRDVESIALFKNAQTAILNEKFKGKSANLKLPLRDGDEEHDEKGEHVKGHWFFNCKSTQRPVVVGTEMDEFTNKLKAIGPSDIKSGDYGRVSVRLYDFEGKSKGIAAGLGNVQKLKDGESLGGGKTADEDFGDLAGGFAD